METTNGNKSTYPVDGMFNGEWIGLTKREYFIGQAIAGCLVNHKLTGIEFEVNTAFEVADKILEKMENESQITDVDFETNDQKELRQLRYSVGECIAELKVMPGMALNPTFKKLDELIYPELPF